MIRFLHTGDWQLGMTRHFFSDGVHERFAQSRLDAVRAGSKRAWQERNYATIIAVVRKIPEKILQEDTKLLMWYDQATTKIGGE